jgi:hypothetical protein
MKYSLLLVVVLAVVAYVQAGNKCCQTVCGPCCEPTWETMCENACKSGYNNCRRSLKTVQSAYTNSLPCKFDCQTFAIKSGDSRIPMFLSCDQPILSYSGTYFKSDNSLQFKCFDPTTWRTMEGSAGKLKLMINLCQRAPFNCVKNNVERYYSDEQIPAVSDLIPQTTTPTYHWYEQFKATTTVVGFTKCASAVVQAATTTTTTAAPTQRCDDDLPNIFAKLSGQPSATMRDNSDSNSECPAGVDPNSIECQEFLGFNVTLPQITSSLSFTERKSIALSATVSSFNADIQPACIPEAVKISTDCVV